MGYTTGETKLANKVIGYLDELQKRGHPIYYEHRSGSGGFNYKKGVPDFFMVINGTHVECELKDVGGKRSTMQDKFKYRCEAVWKIRYICPTTLEEVKNLVEELLRQ